MLEDKQRIQLIESHFEEKLTKEEQLLFEKLMQEDAQFGIEYAFHQKFMNSMDRLGDELFLTNLQNLERQIQIEKTAKKAPIDSLKGLVGTALQKGGQLLDDLAAAFLPIPQYETVLAAASRSTAFEVVLPENGLDCKGGILVFELKKGIDKTLQLSIENNQKTVLIEEVIEAQTTYFEASVRNLEAGLYYWKLKTENDLVMGSFFIRKDLNG
ncbi:MAG: hypothetical protein R3E32_11415 [Chitinophagales bacterium]